MLNLLRSRSTNPRAAGWQTFPAAEPRLAEATPETGPVEHGSPVTRSVVGLESADWLIASGAWESSAGRHVLQWDVDEWVHIQEGEANITAFGETRVLRAGDVAWFPAGTAMTWEVPDHVRKVWLHRRPRTPLPTRVARKLLGRNAASS